MINTLNEKVCRIAYNNNDWKSPSGQSGKSKEKDSFENKYGFGHEEWLFDVTKTINGFHYGFIQSRGLLNQHKGKKYNIVFYTINSQDKSHWIVAYIKEVEVIGEAEADMVTKEYGKRGWEKERVEQLKQVEVLDKYYVEQKHKEYNNTWHFNVKYKPENLVYKKVKLSDELKGEMATRGYRYLIKDFSLYSIKLHDMVKRNFK